MNTTFVSGGNNYSTWLMEKGDGTQTITLRLVRGDTLNPRMVNFNVGGTAVNGTDYTVSPSWSSGNNSVAMNAGNSNIDYTITVSGNSSLVGTKTLIITMQSGYYQIGNATATLTIAQDVPVISVSAPGQYASQNGDYMGQFTLTRSGELTNSVTANLAIGGTATPGSDYISLPSSVTFAANQTSTNLYVAVANANLATAKTVVLSLDSSSSYFQGLTTNATVTILPNSSTTNSVLSPVGMYWRGSGTDPTYWSQVVPLEFETGTVYSNLDGNCSTLYSGLSSWSSQTLYHYDATNSLPQTDTANRIAFNNPIVAFGERVGGTPLYLNQPYSFGIYAGDPILSNQPVVVQAYYRTNYELAGTVSIYPPMVSNPSLWDTYMTNGFQLTTNAYGLTTTLAGIPNLSWGENSEGSFVLTHTANEQSTNYVYIVGVAGNPADKSDPMVIDSGGQMKSSLLYSLEFEQRPPWRSVFLDQPHFNGSPLPPFYSGMTLAEILTNAPLVTNAVDFTPSDATNLDDSPELRRSPILDNFVASMNNDPIALANYVINQIDLTDPMGYNDNGNVAEDSINPPGVARGALGTFLEKQGSPIEQCALLVYLLRQAGVPAVYEFAPHDGVKMLDARLSQMLKFQVHGDFNQAGKLYTTNTMIAVNYPWVAAYIGTNWVHIFPWIKDYRIEEGLNLFDEMPTNYDNAYQWVHDYIYGDSNLLSLAVDGDNTPRVIFPRFLQQTLLQNHPGISVDDIGVKIINRQHYYARWQDFPRPTWVTNVSTPIESLSSSSLTNINPALTNIFDTMSVEIYSLNDPTKDIKTGDMRLVDLHNREFYIHQFMNNGNVQLDLVLMPFRTNITSQFSFTNDPDLLSKEVLSMTFDANDYDLGVRFKYHRHRAITPSYAVDPTLTFLGLNGYNEIDIERPLRVGDQAAICLDYGRVTREMLNVDATALWQMQGQLNANPSQAGSISSDVYEGALMYLAGMSYYEKVSEFNQLNEQWQKFDQLSTFAAGLSKIIPARDSNGNLSNGTDPILPCVDMFFYQTMLAGNGTLHPDSGQNYTMAEWNYNLLGIADDSAEEHQVLNRFYQQTNAVSTVRLLQLAQNSGAGIVPLNIYNYASQGTTNYQGKQLKDWDSDMWQQVVNGLQNSSTYGYVTAFITPGPMTNSAYKGMGALILNPYDYAALISPESLNGGFGGQDLPANTVEPANTPNYDLSDNNDNYSISLTQPASGTTLFQDEVANFDASSIAAQIASGEYAINPFTVVSSGDTSQLLETSPGASDASLSQALLANKLLGNVGNPDDAGSTLWTEVEDPVHSITGEFYVDETDLELPGPFPLTLRRNYSSQDLADNQFGYGWKLSIMPYLSLSKGNTNIYAADMDGAVLAYVHQYFPVSVSAVSRVNGGSAYQAGDILTVAGGTGTAAQIRVDSVGERQGRILSYTLLSGGEYTALPPTPNSPTGGSGSGASFDLTIVSDSQVWIPTLAANPQLNNNTTAGVGSLANRLRDYIQLSVNGTITNYTLYGADGSVRLFQFMNFDSGTIANDRPYLLRWTDSRGNYFTFTYDTNPADADFGQMTRIQSSNGNYLDFDYDIYGHMIDAYTGDGRWIHYDYDNYGDLVTVTLPDNSTRSYQYLHSTQSVTNNGVVTQLPYSTHLIIEEDKPDGRELINAYDNQRRVTNQLSTAGVDLTPIRTATFVYSNDFNITNSFTNGISGYTLIIDGNDHTNRYDYTNSLITKITDPLGQNIQQIWYPDDATSPGYPRSVEERIDKRGLITQYQYDSNGNVTNTVITGDITGDGITSQTATNTAVYNTNSLPVEMTDPVGNSVVTIYDPTFDFLPQQIIHYAGSTPVFTNFMVYGNATNVVVNGNITQTNMAFGLLARKIRAYGSADAATNDMFYDGHGFLTESIHYTGTSDPNVTNTYFYNERGERIIAKDTSGAYTFADYDALDRPTETETFNEYGDPLAWNLTYYNDNGEVSWKDGPRYNPEDYIYYDYDGAGRLDTEIHWRSQAKSDGTGVEAPSGYNLYAQTFYEYDPLGNLILKVDPRGAETANTYDALCRLVQVKHLDTDGGTVLSTEGYGYEPGGEVESYTNALGGITTTLYTTTGKPEYRSNPDGSTNGWRYYLDGRIKRKIQRNGAYWQTTYDDADLTATCVFYSPSGVPEATNSTQLDRRGNVIEKVDAGNNVFTTTFDRLDRPKITAGPAIVTVSGSSGTSPGGPVTYTTNVLQQVSTNFYDAIGRSVTNINALGDETVTKKDALGRTVSTLVYDGSGSLVHEKYFSYSADHNSVTVTNGSGSSAVVNTTYTDNDGNTVLSVAYPSTGMLDFNRKEYDLSGNLDYQEHDVSTGSSIYIYTFDRYSHDGLNRVTSMENRDDAYTYYSYDALNDLTNRIMPGGLQWQAAYNDAGQMTHEQNYHDGNVTRSTDYTYYSTGSPFAGLLDTKTDGRDVTCAYSYDDWLRKATLTYSGSLPEQNLTTTWQYDARGYATNITEQFADPDTGPNTGVQRSYDPYGQLSSESVTDGSFSYSAGQSFDAAGRRTILGIGGVGYNFNWRADGTLTYAADPTGSGSYGYDTAGLLTNRTVGALSKTVTSRDGEGRPDTIVTTVNGDTELTETESRYLDGLLASDTLYRSDFTDSRSYQYADLSRRLTSEQLNLNGSTTWTNTFTYDSGVSGGIGALTQMGQATGSSGEWTGEADVFSKINAETNSTFAYPAYGYVNGQATLFAWLDNQSIPIVAEGTNAMQWQAMMELSPGAHQLKVAALHPSGFYTAWATNWFTNNLAYEAAADIYNGGGEITNRVWRNPDGTVERTQTLSWDARGRLHAVSERDANDSGYDWTTVYGPLNRRLQTTTVLVTNGVALTASTNVINEFYDPQAEFLELGATYNNRTVWKLYGPDLDGVYGSMNGVGGLDGVSPYLNLFNPVISDARGDVLAEVTNGVTTWDTSRPTGYGAVPGYRPPALGEGADMAQASAWRGHWPDVTGYYNLGTRSYDPVSGMWLSFDPVWNSQDPNGYSFCGGDPVNSFDPDGRLSKGFYQSAQNAVVGGASLLYNAAGAAEYALASMVAPNWAYNNLGGYAQNFGNAVTGTAQFGYNVAATATYGLISPFAPQTAYNNYGGNVQQLIGQSPALYGGNNQTTAYQIGYGAGTLGTILMGGEEGQAGNFGKVGQVTTDSSVITDPARLLPAPTGSNPWMPGTVPTSMPAAAGTYIDMAMAPGQIRPGGWGTLDEITDLNFVRDNLAVTPEFKSVVSQVQRFQVPEGMQIQSGIVGPQTFNGVVYPGGANQIQILNFSDRVNLIPVGAPRPIQ